MSVCLYVRCGCMYACMYVYMNIYIYIYTYTSYTFVRAYVYAQYPRRRPQLLVPILSRLTISLLFGFVGAGSEECPCAEKYTHTGIMFISSAMFTTLRGLGHCG